MTTYSIAQFNIDSKIEGENSVTSGVTELIVHADWNPNDLSDADIAIAVLSKTLDFSGEIKPVCLWTATTSHEDLVGTNVRVAGRGKTQDGTLSPIPKWIDTPVASLDTCVRYGLDLKNIRSTRTFCVGDGKEAICSGDSGKIKLKFKRNKIY